MAFGCDFSASPPLPSALAAKGIRFVGRYLSYPGNPKNLTAGELLGLKRNLIQPVLVFETTADRALGGAVNGTADAQAAAEQATLLGLPKTPIYFAVDIDTKDYAPAYPNSPAYARMKLGPIAKYFDAVNAELGKDRVGAYGGYWVIKRLFDASLIKYGWQTYAWSGGQWDARGHIQQTKNGQPFLGIQVDFDESLKVDYGQAYPPLPVAVRRKALRAWILAQRSAGKSWAWLKQQPKWKLWWKLGGR